MLDKLFGWVGLPALTDLLHKLGAGKASAAAIDRVRQFGRKNYLSYKRQAKLAAIKPLLFAHAIALFVHAFVLVAAFFMTMGSAGDQSKFAWVALLVVPAVINLLMMVRLPKVPVFKLDDEGDPVVYPDKVTIGGQEIEHPFAGQ